MKAIDFIDRNFFLLYGVRKKYFLLMIVGGAFLVYSFL